MQKMMTISPIIYYILNVNYDLITYMINLLILSFKYRQINKFIIKKKYHWVNEKTA